MGPGGPPPPGPPQGLAPPPGPPPGHPGHPPGHPVAGIAQNGTVYYHQPVRRARDNSPPTILFFSLGTFFSSFSSGAFLLHYPPPPELLSGRTDPRPPPQGRKGQPTLVHSLPNYLSSMLSLPASAASSANSVSGEVMKMSRPLPSTFRSILCFLSFLGGLFAFSFPHMASAFRRKKIGQSKKECCCCPFCPLVRSDFSLVCSSTHFDLFSHVFPPPLTVYAVNCRVRSNSCSPTPPTNYLTTAKSAQQIAPQTVFSFFLGRQKERQLLIFLRFPLSSPKGRIGLKSTELDRGRRRQIAIFWNCPSSLPFRHSSGKSSFFGQCHKDRLCCRVCFSLGHLIPATRSNTLPTGKGTLGFYLAFLLMAQGREGELLRRRLGGGEGATVSLSPQGDAEVGLDDHFFAC